MTDEERLRWGSPTRKRLFYLALLVMFAVALMGVIRMIV